MGALSHSRWLLSLSGFSLVLALAGAAIAFVLPAHAATLNVCPSSCTYKSINDALAAASPGDVITVGAGTYGPNEPGATTPDTTITINKAVTLQGAGVGQAIINEAPAHAGNPGSAATSGIIYIHNPGGNVTVSGFTIEGAIVNDQNDDGIDMVIQDTGAADTITVSNNLFYSDSTLDPTNTEDQTDAIVLQDSPATTHITGNTFQGVFRAALIEGNPGAVSFTGNTLSGLHGIFDNVTPSVLDYVAEGMLFLVDNDTNVTNPQLVSNNTFENFSGLGIGVDAGYPCCGGLVGAMNSLTISSNTFTMEDATGAQSGNRPIIYLHAFGYTDASKIVSTISGTSITDNVFNLHSTIGQGAAIGFSGEIGANIVVNHDVLIGSGSSAPLNGVFLTSTTGTPGISITNSLIKGFQNGINADTLPVGALITASQNCIVGNSNLGASNGSGASITATNNWWGATSGPHNASTNPSGTGNGASDNVTFTPFLTAHAAVCAGPVASALATNPSSLNSMTGFTFMASLSDATTGQFDIASGQYNVDGGSYNAVSASDGTFDQVTEAVKVHVNALSAGTHTLCVRGTDQMGNQGDAACFKVNVVLAVSGADVAGVPGVGSGPSSPPSTGTGSTSNQTSSTAQQQTGQERLPSRAPQAQTPSTRQVHPSAFGMPNVPTIIGMLMMLIGIGGIGFVLFRVRQRALA